MVGRVLSVRVYAQGERGTTKGERAGSELGRPIRLDTALRSIQADLDVCGGSDVEGILRDLIVT